ncbi:MAG: hypothetical protein QGH39_03545 [Candidatus Thermoplasmatota archaeon]|nr:hypothetical protein [Candidatus Thermoplasmatota archaeon]MDP7264613.1 hypothetical protein [Candidatus Thermoplasmatota archaeon]
MNKSETCDTDEGDPGKRRAGHRMKKSVLRQKVKHGKDHLKKRIVKTRKVMKKHTKHSPWLARLAALLIGIIDGGVIILFKFGANSAVDRIGGETFDVLDIVHWYYIIINPYVLVAILLAVISIIGMTAAFSHERSHRLFSVIGGTSYICIVLASILLLGETVKVMVFIGVGIILISLSISNVYQIVLWFRNKVQYLRGIR